MRPLVLVALVLREEGQTHSFRNRFSSLATRTRASATVAQSSRWPISMSSSPSPTCGGSSLVSCTRSAHADPCGALTKRARPRARRRLPAARRRRIHPNHRIVGVDRRALRGAPQQPGRADHRAPPEPRAVAPPELARARSARRSAAAAHRSAGRRRTRAHCTCRRRHRTRLARSPTRALSRLRWRRRRRADAHLDREVVAERANLRIVQRARGGLRAARRARRRPARSRGASAPRAAGRRRAASARWAPGSRARRAAARRRRRAARASSSRASRRRPQTSRSRRRHAARRAAHRPRAPPRRAASAFRSPSTIVGAGGCSSPMIRRSSRASSFRFVGECGVRCVTQTSASAAECAQSTPWKKGFAAADAERVSGAELMSARLKRCARSLRSSSVCGKSPAPRLHR